MSRSVRIALTGFAVASLVAGSMAAAVATPAPAPAAASNPVQAAVQSTVLAQRLQYDATVTVGETTMTASGAIDLSDSAVDVNVQVGDTRSEFRRVGSHYYVNARSLGSTAEKWVDLDAATQSTQMSFRSVAGLVNSVSPQRTLRSLTSASQVKQVGTDSYGTHYRVKVQQPRAVFVPMIDTFAPGPIREGASARIDVWVDAKGRVSRFTFTTTSVSSTFTLRDLGDQVDITAPPASATGDLNSASGTFLFGAGLRYSYQSEPTPAVTLAPTVEFADGIVQGNLNVTSATGQTMRFVAEAGSNGGKLSVGTVPNALPSGGPASFTVLPYANWLDGFSSRGLETFNVTAREVTAIDTYVTGLRLIGPFAASVIDVLQDMTPVSAQLAPAIGATAEAQMDINVGALAPGDTPLAYTTKVSGYRGTPISTNFFPASGLAIGQTAPVILEAPALGAPGVTNPYAEADTQQGVPGPLTLRTPLSPGAPVFNVITWDPRGEFGSGGISQVSNLYFEGRDVTAILDWAAQNAPVTLNGPNDPAVGMVGSSSGAQIGLAVAGTDPRIDAIVPTMAWNSLIDTLQPNGVLNTDAVSQLLARLNAPGVTANAQLRNGLSAALTKGKLSTSTLTLLANENVGALLSQLQAPTLLVQSTGDGLYPLQGAVNNAQQILSNPFGTPVKMAWFDNTTSNQPRDYTLFSTTIQWLGKYVSGLPIPDAAIPSFQWWDQIGDRYTSSVLPFDPGFNDPTPLEVTTPGGDITIQPSDVRPISKLIVRAPLSAGTQIVGSPSISFTYQGTGTARAVYVRVFDAATGKALGSAATPVPLALDGKRRTVSIAVGDIAYTAQANSQLNVAILSSDKAFSQSSSGNVTLSNVTVDFPRRTLM